MNPKSYWVWNHRHWILEHMPEPVWDAEMALVDKMLNLDQRNFHGWDYRRWLVSQSNVSSPRKEFDYTTNKIHQNFSNYSAWHNRSNLLPLAFSKEERAGQLERDFELVRSAIFTEPADQSAWLYQRWLIANFPSAQVIDREIGYIRELLELEPDAKWPLLALVFLLKEKGDTDEISTLLEKLMVVDPMRRGYYQHLYS
jgi:hypothetical protein